jgi:SAM-dependent methyltransferase
MYFDEDTLLRLYTECFEEYNKTKLATEMGFYFTPNDFTILQLKQIVKYLPGNDALFVDIGTGMGIAPRFVKKLGIRSISVDSPMTGGFIAIETVKEAGVEGFYCEVGREAIPIEDESADLVLLADVIEHLPHSPKPVLKEIKRILKPQGVCIATTPNSTRLTVRLKVALGYSSWPLIFNYFDKDFHDGHHHEYTISEFKEVFNKLGFIEKDFILYEKFLRYTEISSLKELKGKIQRNHSKTVKSPFIFKIGKAALLFITKMFPNLSMKIQKS